MRTWNWYDGSHDDIAGREEEMMEIEVVVITESGEDMTWGVMVVVVVMVKVWPWKYDNGGRGRRVDRGGENSVNDGKGSYGKSGGYGDEGRGGDSGEDSGSVEMATVTINMGGVVTVWSMAEAVLIVIMGAAVETVMIMEVAVVDIKGLWLEWQWLWWGMCVMWQWEQQRQ